MKPNLNGTGAGHMVAAYGDGGDVVFMDANFGEFWLPDRDAFEKFIVEYFKIAYLSGGKQKYKATKPYHFIADRGEA
jgi:Yersinia/Haemophilus virulence surface antigen